MSDIKQELANATKEKLDEDSRVQKAEVSRNEKGIYVEAKANDRMDAESLRDDLHAYPVFVKVIA